MCPDPGLMISNRPGKLINYADNKKMHPTNNGNRISHVDELI